MADKNAQLVMCFKNSNGQEVKLTIRSPSTTDSATVSEVMDGIITLGAFSGNYNVSVVEKTSAKLIHKELQTVEVQ